MNAEARVYSQLAALTATWTLAIALVKYTHADMRLITLAVFATYAMVTLAVARLITTDN